VADLTIKWWEPVIGKGHLYLEPTVDRVLDVETDPDGHGKFRYYKEQAAPPPTGPGQVAIFAMRQGGVLSLYYREENNGAIRCLGGTSVIERGYKLIEHTGPGQLTSQFSVNMPDLDHAVEKFMGASQYPPTLVFSARIIASAANTLDIITRAGGAMNIYVGYEILQVAGTVQRDVFSTVIQASGGAEMSIPISNVGDKDLALCFNNGITGSINEYANSHLHLMWPVQIKGHASMKNGPALVYQSWAVVSG
jgi:hypothetical protein